MSAYSFIATDYEIQEVHNSKEKIITVQEAIKLGLKAHEFMPWENMNPNDKISFFEKEDDLYELVITKGTEYERNVRWYTDKPFIYSVNFKYTELRAKQLLEYIKENLIKGYQLEIWSIWLDDRQNIKPTICNYEQVSIDNLKQMYDWNDEKHVTHGCIIIKR
ncbi:hypothetical protein [Clostridium scatologenes]|uniref:Putative Mg2+ and Co2+ transporter CorC n=1 Tax=Clostridium scatologenes TaxID=1548 RepID=A0A0E3GSH0_CLOSL|nr:hypothetical protein [Clostridium scatologenes]AKA72056.1 putative Mg2+ and Co2+ transporter CorC [Clostridium scatologenes]